MGTMSDTFKLLDPKLGQRSRQMSLSTKKQEDPIELIKKATKLCINPIKITWKDAFYEIDLPTTE